MGAVLHALCTTGMSVVHLFCSLTSRDPFTLWGRISLWKQSSFLCSKISASSLRTAQTCGSEGFAAPENPKAAPCCNSGEPSVGGQGGTEILAAHSSLNYGPEAQTSFCPDDSQEIPSPSAIIAEIIGREVQLA